MTDTLTMNKLWLGDLDSFNVHVEALRRIIALRGGEDALGWDVSSPDLTAS